MCSWHSSGQPDFPLPWQTAGSSYNSVNYAQSAIAQELLMIQFVLCYLKSLGSNQSLSLKDLTYKALFYEHVQLLPEWTLSPTWDVKILVLRSVLSFDDQTLTNISSLQDHYVVNQWRSGEAKQTRLHSRFLRVQIFSEDPELCPSQTLSEYFTKVSFFFGRIHCLINL